jgi:hypothetical protein
MAKPGKDGPHRNRYISIVADSGEDSVMNSNRATERQRHRCRPVAGAAVRQFSQLAALALLLFFAAPCASAQAQSASEYQVKAAFLLNIAKFVDWPDASLGSPQDPFTVCIIGQDPFGDALDKTLAGKTVGARNISVDRFPFTNNPAAPRRCQIAFVSSSEKHHWRDVISAFRATSTLLVGDSDGFAASGGAVEFLIEDGHIRFAINPEAADRANLKVSSKLLSLAKIIHDDPGKG